MTAVTDAHILTLLPSYKLYSVEETKPKKNKETPPNSLGVGCNHEYWRKNNVNTIGQQTNEQHLEKLREQTKYLC